MRAAGDAGVTLTDVSTADAAATTDAADASLPPADAHPSIDGDILPVQTTGITNPAWPEAGWDGCLTHAPRIRCYQRAKLPPPPHVYVLWVADGVMALVNSGLLVWLFVYLKGLSRSYKGEAPHLQVAFQAIAFIPALMIFGAHLYGLSSFLLGYSYLGDFARPALVSVGMLAVGALFGALLGLPDRSQVQPTGAGVGKEGEFQPALVAPFGTRLQDVADWLTKLLLGAGLTQLGTLWSKRTEINRFFANASGINADRPLGTVLAAASLASGFMLGYVATLLFLPVALEGGLKALYGIIGGRSARSREPSANTPNAASSPGAPKDNSMAALDQAEADSRARRAVLYVMIDRADDAGLDAHASNIEGVRAAVTTLGDEFTVVPVSAEALRDLSAEQLDAKYKPLAIFGAGSFSEWFNYGVDDAWRATLDHYMRVLRETRIPLLAVCGSHQLVAAAFNGWSAVAHMNDTGPPVPISEELATTPAAPRFPTPRVGEEGIYPVKSLASNDPLLKHLLASPSFSVHHKDEVIKTDGFCLICAADTSRPANSTKPDQAQNRCVVQALKSSDPTRLLYTTQFHPEIARFPDCTEVDDGGAGRTFLVEFFRTAMAYWSPPPAAGSVQTDPAHGNAEAAPATAKSNPAVGVAIAHAGPGSGVGARGT